MASRGAGTDSLTVPFCSVIIPTIGRPSLSRAIASVVAQPIGAEDIEIIVVNDSGAPLPDYACAVSATNIVSTTRRERSVARNVGAAVARGRYLYFLDDDDWLLPDALGHFHALAAKRPDAVWLYGDLHVVDDRGRLLGTAISQLQGDAFAQVLGGAWIPLQASLIRTDAFFDVGGFDPSICGTEDLDLTRRIVARGHLVGMQLPVACLFRGAGWQTSTDYDRAAEDTRRSRDRIVDMPGTLSRIRASAHASPDGGYWLGRAVRVLWSAASLNFREGRPLTGASRLLHSLAVMLLAGRAIGTRAFWAAVGADHVPGSLHFIVRALEENSMNEYAQRPVDASPAVVRPHSSC